MKKFLAIAPIFLTAMFLTSCGEEESYIYPDLITEISCLQTDSKGFGTRIITDEGEVWHLQEGNRPSKLTADSTYRVVSRFAPLTSSDASQAEAKAYSFYSVIAPLPEPKDKYPTIKTDPVSIQSIWRSGNYLNLILQVKIKDQEHELSFIDNGIILNDDERKTLTLMLFHDRKNDVEGFDQKYYLSVPLWHYQGILNKGDEIVFQLNTYKEGMTSRTFTY